MNCPNCGGRLNIDKRYCEYCDTTFTKAELGEIEADKTSGDSVEEAEPQRAKTLTEQKQEELKKERENRKGVSSNTDVRNIATGAAVMGVFSLFSGVRRFFRNLQRTACFLLLIALEACFAFLMISGKVVSLLDGELQGFVAVNIVILINALLAGLVSRVGFIRAGVAITAVVNFLAVVWVFIYPLIAVDFAGQTPQSVAILAVVEMAVLALSVVFSHLVYKR